MIELFEHQCNNLTNPESSLPNLEYLPSLTSLETHNNTTPKLGDIASMTDTSVAVDQSPLTIAKVPSFCRLCNVELRGLQTWRAHVKSDGQ